MLSRQFARGLSTSGERICIVGGVAGGGSAAARTRRNCEACSIVVFERGPYVSFANCGLPYYVGDVIKDESKLLVATPKAFKDRMNVDVRINSNVKAINRVAKTITVQCDGEEYEEAYDKLILAPGAAPFFPAVPGRDLPGIFSLRTVPDSRVIKKWIEEHNVKTCAIIGGGFIGLEMAENIQQRGIDVTLVERGSQILPNLDGEMTVPISHALAEHGIDLRLNASVVGFEHEGSSLGVQLDSGGRVRADMVILAAGVRPEVALARDAGLVIGDKGGVMVDENMRTSDAAIWAVGDAVEVPEFLSHEDLLVPLAGPANRQGRLVGDNVTSSARAFRGVQGTAVLGGFGLTVASTGQSEKFLDRLGGARQHASVFIHPGHHVGYYPGATPIHMKLLFDTMDGTVLGAQAVGEHGVEKRIDVVSMAIQMGAKVSDLAEAELCYAPQFGAAKDPVNLAGMVACNVMEGKAPLASWDPVLSGRMEGGIILDVRMPSEVEAYSVEGALNIPIDDLRDRLDEVPKDTVISVLCAAGQRAYYATRTLRQHGYDARFLSGGCQTHAMKMKFKADCAE